VEADEDTDAEAGADPVVGAAKSASAVATAISSVRAAEQKKKRKRRVASPSAVATPMIPTPCSWEVGSEDEKEKEKDEAVEELPVPEDQAAGRPESPAAKRQRELVQKTSEEALRRGLEAQRSAAAARVKIPVAIKPRVFWPKIWLPTVARYGLKS
jgi:hypothetical protein